MSNHQTDNTYIRAKINLRVESLPNKGELKVLECFAGNGKIWNVVKSKTDKQIQILKIEKDPDKKDIYLRGDNVKFLGLMNLEEYDIIDLDAYGIPLKQIQILFERNYGGIVHLTVIQSAMGRLNKLLLKEIGYTSKMIKKIPTLFCKNGLRKVKQYLAKNGIKKIRHITKGEKMYLWFNMQDRQTKGGQNVTYL